MRHLTHYSIQLKAAIAVHGDHLEVLFPHQAFEKEPLLPCVDHDEPAARANSSGMTLTLEEPLCRLPVPVELVVEAAGLGSTDEPSSST